MASKIFVIFTLLLFASCAARVERETAGTVFPVDVVDADVPSPLPPPSDEVMKSALERKFIVDRYLNATEIKVSAKDGVVTLAGTVPTLRAKERASRLAEGLRGARAVINRLRLAETNLSEQALQKRAELALELDSATRDESFSVKVSNAKATISGEADSWAEAALAAWVVKGVSGIRSVENNIKVEYPMIRSATDIARDIQGKFRQDPWIAENLIRVQVDGSAVRLSGVVGSLSERVRAYNDAWVTGVGFVDISALEVDPARRNEMINPAKFKAQTDEEIKRAVSDALVYDARVKAQAIEVMVNEGVVTLQGAVNDLRAKRAAENDARNTIGVRKVVNQLNIVSKNLRRDRQIADDVRAMLGLNPLVDQHQISVSVNDGVVRLAGSVDSLREKLAAEEDASRIRGVEEIRNELKLGPEVAKLTDSEIEKNIEQIIKSNHIFDVNDRVFVSVQDATATLRGRVDSLSEKMLATNEALAGGAFAVYNGLQVRTRGGETTEGLEYSVYPTDIYNFYLFPNGAPSPGERSIGSETLPEGLDSRPLQRIMRPEQ